MRGEDMPERTSPLAARAERVPYHASLGVRLEADHPVSFTETWWRPPKGSARS